MNREEIASEIANIMRQRKLGVLSNFKAEDRIIVLFIVELENATKELKQKLEDERYIKATVIENAKREARVEAVNEYVCSYLIPEYEQTYVCSELRGEFHEIATNSERDFKESEKIIINNKETT